MNKSPFAVGRDPIFGRAYGARGPYVFRLSLFPGSLSLYPEWGTAAGYAVFKVLDKADVPWYNKGER